MIELLKERVRTIRRSRHDMQLQRNVAAVDAFLVSYPKSGRTWLRYLLSLYLADAFRLGFEPDLRTTFRILPNYDLDQERGLPSATPVRPDGMPLVAVSHRDFQPGLFGQAPVIMLVRDPRDVLVSSYFHQTRHKHRFEGDIREFLDCPDFGAASIADYHNRWVAGLAGRQSMTISYEAMSKDAHGVVRSILRFLDLPIDESALDKAVGKAQFDRMQKKERQTGIPGHAYDREEDDALRVRRGKVGGYTDYLNEEMDARVKAIFANRLTQDARELYRLTGLQLQTTEKD